MSESEGYSAAVKFLWFMLLLNLYFRGQACCFLNNFILYIDLPEWLKMSINIYQCYLLGGVILLEQKGPEQETKQCNVLSIFKQCIKVSFLGE